MTLMQRVFIVWNMTWQSKWQFRTISDSGFIKDPNVFIPEYPGLLAQLVKVLFFYAVIFNLNLSCLTHIQDFFFLLNSQISSVQKIRGKTCRT